MLLINQEILIGKKQYGLKTYKILKQVITIKEVFSHTILVETVKLEYKKVICQLFYQIQTEMVYLKIQLAILYI